MMHLGLGKGEAICLGDPRVQGVEGSQCGAPLDWEEVERQGPGDTLDRCRGEQGNQWITECLGDLTGQGVDNLGIACALDPSYRGGLSPAASSLEHVAAVSFRETQLAQVLMSRAG